MNFDWAELAFASKKPINSLKATFIAAPREMSVKRFTQLVKEHLPKSNLVLGLAKEPYVLELEGQPQFKMLSNATVQPIIDKVNASQPKFIISTLTYNQRDIQYLLEKLDFTRVLFVNGSWYHSLHYRPEFYVLARRGVPYERISPFVDEAEAREYAEAIAPSPPVLSKQPVDEMVMLKLVDDAAAGSFSSADYQTGAALGRRKGKLYQPLAASHNRVVPFETYAWHHGAAREQNFSPMNDLNHYDTNHAEVELLIDAQRRNLTLKETTLFVNLSPCPTCARMLARTDITELVYRNDHSEGYAVRLLEATGKKVRRIA